MAHDAATAGSDRAPTRGPAGPSRPARRPRRTVRVFERDGDLLEGVEPATVDFLRRRVAVPALTLPRGAWSPPRAEGPLRGALGLLVLDGVLVRSIRPHGRDYPELLGAGDLLRPWDDESQISAADCPCAWRVLQPALVAVLDARFAANTTRWPSIMATLLARGASRSRDLALHLAISRIRQADKRLLMLFWHLADRWGRVTPDGVLLALPLTHELLGQLVNLHRPTASTALAQLTQAGEIARRPDRGWMLLGEPPAHRAVRRPASGATA